MKQHLSNKVHQIRLLVAWRTLAHGNILLDPRHILYVLLCHIVINLLLEITSRRFGGDGKRSTWTPFTKIKQLMMTLLTIGNINVELKVPSSTSHCPNPNWMKWWVIDKTNTSFHTYHALNSCGIDNLSRIYTMVFLHRLEVYGHDLDYLVEDHCWLS
jgi:hypothetical protein